MSVSNPVPSAPSCQETVPFALPRLGIALRVVLILAGVGMLALLGTAGRLSPDPAGLGTHHQLSLPPCSLRQLFNIRCPSCGMTTSWSYMMHGRVLQSFAVNSGGALLAIVSIVAGPWMLVTGLWGRTLGPVPAPEWIAGGSVVIGLVTLVDWGLRLSHWI